MWCCFLEVLNNMKRKGTPNVFLKPPKTKQTVRVLISEWAERSLTYKKNKQTNNQKTKVDWSSAICTSEDVAYSVQ